MKIINKFHLILAVGIFFFTTSVFSVSAQINREQIEKLQRALQIIDFAYVEETDDEVLVEHAIRGMLKELDPHSVYLSADELRRANEPLQGSFDGIGIQFQIISDTIVVISPIPGGPSEKVGIMAGDKIVVINGESSAGSQVTNQMVQEKLRGRRGSQVDVGIFRRGASEILDFTITRDRIPIHSLDAAFMATPEIGYIKINRFSRTTMREFRDAIDLLKNNGMQDLILDLNNNSGGYLDVAIDLTDQFLERDQLIVYTEGHASPTQEFNSTSRGYFKQGKLVVLINEGSASASEILSGAIQDWDRGLLVGRRTFGKGLVQRPFDLPDGSAIRLTTARYHTPTGRSIQKPYDEGTDKYFDDLSERLRNGELVSMANISFPDSLKYFTKNNQRVVYGGGGIMPDFFVPVDTTRVSTFYSRVMRRGVLNTFCIEYTNENRLAFNQQYPQTDHFVKHFEVDDHLLQRFFSYAEEQGISSPEIGADDSEVYLRNQIKGLIARNLYDFGAYIQVSVQMDDSYNKALEILRDNTFSHLSIKYN
jgi:carboxyl-terminal processing protease